MDEVQREAARHPPSCHSTLNLTTVSSVTLRQHLRQLDQSSVRPCFIQLDQPSVRTHHGMLPTTPAAVNTKTSTQSCVIDVDQDEPARQTTTQSDDVVLNCQTALSDDVVLDLSVTSRRQSQSACPPVNSAAQWEMYRRYMQDLKRLDDLIQRRTYERNVVPTQVTSYLRA